MTSAVFERCDHQLRQAPPGNASEEKPGSQSREDGTGRRRNSRRPHNCQLAPRCQTESRAPTGPLAPCSGHEKVRWRGGSQTRTTQTELSGALSWASDDVHETNREVHPYLARAPPFLPPPARVNPRSIGKPGFLISGISTWGECGRAREWPQL